MKQITIKPKEDLIFDLKVREMCKWCKRYGKKATCPPHIESVEYYSTVLEKFKHGIIYYDFFPTGGDAEEVGYKSSMEIYKKVTDKRIQLFAEGHYLIMVLGAGSCKLCDRCTFPCHIPDQGIIPVEATGIDVVKMMEQHGVKISFPVSETLIRVGMVLYD